MLSSKCDYHFFREDHLHKPINRVRTPVWDSKDIASATMYITLKEPVFDVGIRPVRSHMLSSQGTEDS